MLSDEDIERRLVDLEVKAAFAEDLVEQLNDIVVRQQAQIDALVRELGRLRDQAAADGSEALGRLGNSLDERPPHY